MDIDYVCFLACLIALFLRLSPRIFWKKFDGTDSYFHIYFINLIKKNNHTLPQKEERVLGGSNYCNYPYFYHWLLSFFPSAFINWWDKFSGSIFDILTGYFLVWSLKYLSFIDFSEACLLFSLYILSPGLTFSFIGPRPFSLTPRNFSQLIFTVACTALIVSLSYPFYSFYVNALFFVLAMLLFSIILLSSQFGTQVCMCLLLVSLFNRFVGICLIMGFIGGVIFSKGFLITQIKAHIEHLTWYYKCNYAFVQHKSNFTNLMINLKNKNIRGLFYEILFFNQLTSSFLKHITYFIVIFITFFHLSPKQLNSYQMLILEVCIAMFIPFIFTNFGKMKVFGEAERYIEFVFPLQTFLFISILSNFFIMYFICFLLMYNLLFYFYNLYQIEKQHKSKYNFQNIINQLNKTSILLCLSNNESYIFLKETQAKVVGFLVNITLKERFNDFFKNFFIHYPMINPKEINNLCKQFEITHILKNKKHNLSEIYDEEIMKLNKYSVCYEDEVYVLYENKNSY